MLNDICPTCRLYINENSPVQMGENGMLYHINCKPKSEPLTENDVRRIVREELARAKS